jgi:hypothetical protein
MNQKKLGLPKTIGELRELIKDYPDETEFGFFNQPMQELWERVDEDEKAVVFNGLSDE